MTSLPSFQDLFDPRGRASRSGLLMIALWLMAADLVAVVVIVTSNAAFTGAGALAFKIVSVWIATAGVSRRLHDLDLSAWWVAKGLAALIGWSVVVAALLLTRFDAADALNPGHPAFWINVTATATPVLVALIWLHLAPGTTGANRYGAAPGAHGFSAPDADASRSSSGAEAMG